MSSSPICTLDLGSEPSIKTVGQLRDQLSAALAQHDQIEIWARELNSIDLSVLQLLASAHRSATAAGKTLTISAAPDGPLQAALRRAGFVSASGEPLTKEGSFWTSTGKIAA